MQDMISDFFGFHILDIDRIMFSSPRHILLIASIIRCVIFFMAIKVQP